MKTLQDNADILQFPAHLSKEKEINLPQVNLDDLIIEYDKERIEQETAEVNDFLDKTHKEYHLPPFVLKMRQISSINDSLDHIRKLNAEIEYYLKEIETYQKKK